MKLWMMRSDGQPSASVTFAVIAFIATTLWFVLAIFGKIGPITIKPFDSGAAMAYLTPILTLYFGRRWTDAQTQKNTTASPQQQASMAAGGGVVANTMPTVTPAPQPSVNTGQINNGLNSDPSGVVSNDTSNHVGD